MSTPPRLDEVLRRVSAHEPDLVGAGGGWQAATALVIAGDDASGLDVLFIERASRGGDRWSGQMALPGGRRDPGDRDLADTAARETLEEVGLAVPDPVGRLDDHRERFSRGYVATFVYAVEQRPDLVLQEREVSAAVWIPLHHLLHPDTAVKYRYKGMGPFAGLEYDGYTVWGLTLGILDGFADVIGHELPRPGGFTLG